MPDRPAATPQAMNALVDALLHPGAFSEYTGELSIYAAIRAGTVADLLALFDPVSIRTSEWTSDLGLPWRAYVGRLPCGLMLRIVTRADLVPPVELPRPPEGGETRGQ